MFNVVCSRMQIVVIVCYWMIYATVVELSKNIVAWNGYAKYSMFGLDSKN